jgi:hypothetical protein
VADAGEEALELLHGPRVRLLPKHHLAHQAQLSLQRQPVRRQEPPLVRDDTLGRRVDSVVWVIVGIGIGISASVAGCWLGTVGENRTHRCPPSIE